MKHVAILLAGGSGSRMAGSVKDKVLVEIHGRPVFAHVLQAFRESATMDALVVVARDVQQQESLAGIVSKENLDMPVFFTLGGRERQDSVQAGLDAIPPQAEWVMIHDCARPAVTPLSIQALLKTTMTLNCAVSLAHRVTDTIRMFEHPPVDTPVSGDLLDRKKLWAMETPQAFPRKLIEEAHARLRELVTDDLAAVEMHGKPVALVESLLPNPKITRPADLLLLESLLRPTTMNDQTNMQIRTGYGYDIHQLKRGLTLILGGVRIDSDVGLVGHSDADVLSHAIADAILGGCGLPDIGHYFPNTDATIAVISSLEILKRSVQEADKVGMQLVNVDATLIAEQPRISPYISEMKVALAKTLQIDPGDIGIKATTQEGIGALGAGEGIAAHAVATLSGVRRKSN